MSTVPWLERLSNTKSEELDPGLDPVRFFDDSGANELRKKVDETTNTIDGMNTKPIDPYRQGVEIRLNKYRFLTTQPKLWAGNLKQWIFYNPVGQDTDFTNFDKTTEYLDNKVAEKWNPVAHLSDPPNSFILLNNGLQQKERSTIEPFVIPGKKNTVDDLKNPITGIKQDGGIPVFQRKRNIDNDTIFLEENRSRFSDHAIGEEFVFMNGSSPLFVNSWEDSTQEKIAPYHDEIQVNNENNPILRQLTNASNDIILALIQNSNLDLDETSQGGFEFKSATAGIMFSDRNTARYGTDSIAFGGLSRGW